MPKDVLISQGA